MHIGTIEYSKEIKNELIQHQITLKSDTDSEVFLFIIIKFVFNNQIQIYIYIVNLFVI